MYESYRDLFLIVILCHNWYMSLVKRLIFTQCMYGMWIDNFSKTSQKKKLGNVCTMYYVDFILFFLLLRDSETFVVFSYGEIQLWKTHICVLESFLPVAVKLYTLKLKIHKFKNQESASQFFWNNRLYLDISC